MNEVSLLLHPPTSFTARLLTSNHLSLISIGGIIGTGLFFGIRNSLINGAFLSLFSYIYISFLCLIVIRTTGEMASFMPINGAVCSFQFKFLSPIFGLSINSIYWLSWCLTFALELSLLSSILTWWHEFNQLYITFGFWLFFVLINLLPVNNFGQFESFITMIKIIFLTSWIILSIFLVTKNGNGFTYWSIKPNYNIASSLISACFTFQSIESVAICSGEIKNPEINIPKSIKYVMVRIIIFYIGTLFLLTLMISPKDSRLFASGSDNDIFQSPFLIGLLNCGLNESSIMLSIFNLVILILIMSAANSNVYFGSRCLISICESGFLSTKIMKTYKGVPYISVLLTSSIGLMSLLLKFKSVEVVFNLLIKLCSTAGLLMWVFVLFSYLRFRKALEFNGIEYKSLPYNSNYPNLMIKLTYVTIISICSILLFNGISNLKNFEWEDFFASYATLIVLMILIFGLKAYWKLPWLVPVDQIILTIVQDNNRS